MLGKTMSLTVFCVLFIYQMGMPGVSQAEVTKTEAQPAQKETDSTNSAEAPKKASEVELLQVEKEIVDQTNAQRARYGLPPLIVDRSLERTARAHAAWMTNNRTLQHTSMSVGENIAMGQPTSGAAIGDWMNSSGHRANILSGSYHRIGVAGYHAPDGTTYWCQQFLP
jgi:uncharacterized protein YkwD